MYVVTSPSLVAACDRRARTISFAPYVVTFAKRVMKAGQATIDLLSEDLFEDQGPVTLRPETTKAMHEALKRGDLNDTLQASLKSVQSFLDSEDRIGDGSGTPLFHWVRRFLTTASTRALYGPENPVRTTKLMDDFWKVDQDFGLLGVDVAPEFVAPEANRARERFFEAFRQYYASGGLKGASRFIKARYEVNKKHGVENKDIAQFDLGVCTALLVNTVPAMSWTLYYAFSDPTFLAQLREGIEAVVSQSNVTPEPLITSVNIPQVIEAFPFLQSFVREALRVQSHGSSARFVLEDTFVDDTDGTTYLLKKNSILTMPSALVHGSEAGWGPDAKEFNASRFIESQTNVKVTASSYRVFGGGNAICPGKQFALNLMMSVLLIMVLRYDIVPVEGRWKKPKPKNHISTSFLMPTKDVMVHIQPRKQNARWNFVWEPK
ncbi:cytochrome P450 [Hypoxylon sp. FL1857]|nr:cytochrome P450 [Hypoxylon sp. FL1857]